MEKGRGRLAAWAAVLSFALALGLAPAAFADAPLNDDFAASSVLPSSSSVAVAGTTVEATSEPGEPSHWKDQPPVHTVWYSWTAPSEGSLVLEVDGSYTTVAIYTGDDVAGLDRVLQQPPFSIYAGTLRVRAEAGVTYRIAVAGMYDGQTHRSAPFDLSLTLSPLPANDDFEDAEVLTGTSATASGSFDHATHEIDEPRHADVYSRTQSVWYSWTAPSDGGVLLDATWGGGTAISIYTGEGYGSLSPVASNKSRNSNAKRYFRAEAGVTYKIVLSDTHQSGGGFRLALTESGPPANDDFADAESIAAGRAPGTLVGATLEPGEPSTGGEDGASVWYRWTATAHERAYFQITSSELPESVVTVYTGATLDTLRRVGGGVGIHADWGARVGTTYYVRVDSGEELAQGPFEYAFGTAPRPLNDDFDTPFVLAGPDASGTGNNHGATDELGEPTHCRGYGEQSIWWTWTAPAAGRAKLEVDATFEWTSAVYTGDAVDDLTRIAVGASADAQDFEVHWWAKAGETYRIAVDSETNGGRVDGDGDVGVRVRLGDAPANDDQADAKVLTGLSADAFTSTEDAYREYGENWHAGARAAHSVWYAWEAPVSGPVTIDTTRSSFDTRVAIYDKFYGPSSADGRVTFNAVAGHEYLIAVDGVDGATGGMELTLRQGSPWAPNDDIDDPWTFGEMVQMRWQNDLATREPGEPRHAGDRGGASMWFKWVPKESTTFRVTTNHSEIDTVMAMYEGTPGALTEVASDDDSGIGTASGFITQVEAGKTYYLAVDGKFGENGPAQGIFWVHCRTYGPTEIPKPVDQEDPIPPPTTGDEPTPPGEGDGGGDEGSGGGDPPGDGDGAGDEGTAGGDPPGGGDGGGEGDGDVGGDEETLGGDPPDEGDGGVDDSASGGGDETSGGAEGAAGEGDDSSAGDDGSTETTSGESGEGGLTSGDSRQGGTPAPEKPRAIVPAGAAAPRGATLRLTASVPKVRLAKALSRGIGGSATCSAACRLDVVVTLPGLKNRTAVVNGAAGKRTAFRVRLKAADRRLLRRSRRVAVTVIARSAAGTAVVQRRLSLR
ncbi:MAG TPA: hypothetical protein VF587_14330 [Solirubrobacteraceae bacterium]|jgi:hypothetical protein